MSSRMKQTTDKKTKRYKRTSWFLIIIFLLCVMGFATIFGMLFAEYEQTEKWTGSDLDQEIASIPPEFAQNTYDMALLDDIQVLGSIETSLALIDENDGLTNKSIDTARTVADVTEKVLTEYAIESGGSYENLKRLQLYIDIFDIEQSIYKTLDTETLASILSQLRQRTLFMDNDVDARVLSRLNSIVDDINRLNTFIDTVHADLGEMTNDTLLVPTTMTRADTDTMLTLIEDQGLTVFDDIKHFKAVLESNAWETVLSNNETLRDIAKWTDQQSVFNTLNRGQYRHIGALPTLDTVNGLDWVTIQGISSKNRQEVLGSSVIRTLSVNSHTVTTGQYVKNDLMLTAVIEPVYRVTSIPEPSSLPTFDNESDYTNLTATLSELLTKRDQRLEQERLEQERLEQEQLEQEQLEQEQLEQERLEQEQLEQERLEQEQLEQERLEQEQLEQEQLEQEKPPTNENNSNGSSRTQNPR